MAVRVYQYTCEVCGDKKTTMTDFKLWKPPEQLSCEADGCWGPMRWGPYTGVQSSNIEDGSTDNGEGSEGQEKGS